MTTLGFDNTEVELLGKYNKLIRDWASERGITGSNGLVRTQQLKFMSELGEFCDAEIKHNMPEVVDAIGDMYVVAINAATIYYRERTRCDVTETLYDHIDAIMLSANTLSDAFVVLPMTLEEIVRALVDALFNGWYTKVVACLVALANMYKLKLSDCVASAYNVIKNRTGKTLENGNFVKE